MVVLDFSRLRNEKILFLVHCRMDVGLMWICNEIPEIGT
jgi:hypothetical protein